MNTSEGGSASERSAAAAASGAGLGSNELPADVSIHQQRPLPPSALRKRSVAAAAAASIHANVSLPSTPQLEEGFEEDVTKEDLERALEGLSRDDLVTALGRAKKAMDSLDAQLESRTLELQELQAFTEDLIAKSNLSAADQQSIKQAVAQRDERNDHLLREQERLEEELYTQLQIVERLRRQLAESERAQGEAERRYTDQTTTADKERQAFADMEALLRSQKASESAANEKLAAENQALQRENERMANHIAALQAHVSSSSTTGAAALSLDDNLTGDDGLTPGARRARAKSAADAEAVALRSELAAAQKAQASYVSALTQLQNELSEVKNENAQLRDTNYSLIDILQEKSFSGALFAESAMLSRRFQGKGGREAAAASMLESDTTDDADSDSDADTASHTTGNTDAGVQDDVDDDDDVPDRPRTPVKPTRRRKGAKQNVVRSRRNSNALLEVPTDLGSELAQSGGLDEEKNSKGKKRDRSGQEVSEDKDVLQKEVIELRETNAALSVYIAKVIDRVLARDGFERVLSTDPETKRAGIASQRASKGRARPSILPVHADASNAPRPQSSSSGEGAQTSPSKKRQSMGILGFGRSPLASGNDAGLNSVSAGAGMVAAANGSSSGSKTGGNGGGAASGKDHARSRMSVDWRGLLSGIGGGGSSTAKDPREANLRPLVLRGASSNLSSTSSSGGSNARKVAESEEVEDQMDEFERERIRADLQMQGYSPPENQLRQRTTSTTGRPSLGGGSSITAFLSRVVSGTSGSNNVSGPASGPAGATTAEGSQANSVVASPASVTSPGAGSGSGSSVRDLLADHRTSRASAALQQQQQAGESGNGNGNGNGNGANELGSKIRFPSTAEVGSGYGTRTSSMAGDESYLVRER
ncbi:hypothetical protein OC834_002654 [Tilletia horrida]|nr:hypothetical protein OC834_002654 [Tilletia horrida]